MEKFKPNYDDGMWKGAPKSSFGKALDLRNRETEAEKLLWEELRGNKVNGLKFRRQHPVSLFIADFYCHKLKLVIEIDGEYHFTKEQILKDKERTEILNSNGLEVIRFKNEEVIKNINSVLDCIKIKAGEILKKIENPNFPDSKGS